ncbi:MAG: rRNA maturation RNase YbeY [Holosporales bacterium]|jgi:probable rRNA maturation factor|nr:rRNA maturation RNase YbeY [Holosporales bacterium]
MTAHTILDIADARWLDIFSKRKWIETTRTCSKHVFNEVAWSHYSIVEFVLSSDEEIQVLNKQYRQKDKPTNVLSFPLLEFSAPTSVVSTLFLSNELLGTVVLSIETVLKESVVLDVPVKNRVIHLMVHGVLHLLGYDHEKDSDAIVMESLEIVILQRLGIPNLYVSVC